VAKMEQDTAIILLDYATISTNAADDDQTMTDSNIIDISNTTIISEYNTTLIDESIDTTTILDVTKNDTDQGVDDTTVNSVVAENDVDRGINMTNVIQNDTSMIISDADEYSNETTALLPKAIEPICDLSCQCSKKCLYGFEILNDTCQCDPPCKVSYK
jgi:hypothetical protein